MQTGSPLFSNDLAGFVKAAMMVSGPIFAGVLLYLKSGTREKISDVRHDAENADETLKESIAEAKRIAERASEALKGDVNGLGTRVDNLVVEMTRIRTDVDNVKGTIVESQRDIMGAIAASSEAQLRAVHAADLAHAARIADLRVDVGKLQERHDLGQCVSEFGKSIERLVELLAERDK